MTAETPLIVVAIDGPAGSGKSTIAKAFAQRVGVEYLDTGAMYRSVAFASMQAGVEIGDLAAVAAVAANIELDMSDGQVMVNGHDATEAIRGAEVTAAVSQVAANPGVRAPIVDLQRTWVRRRGAGVLEGRDIGTVVFPDAALKVYLTASVTERARRRALQTGQTAAEVEADMLRRDRADSSREHSPLRQAGDAVEVDTTELSIDGVVDVLVDLYEQATNPREEPER